MEIFYSVSQRPLLSLSWGQNWLALHLIVYTIINIDWILLFFVFLLSDSNLHFYLSMTFLCEGLIFLPQVLPVSYLLHYTVFLRVDLVGTQWQSQELYLRDTCGDGVTWSHPHCLTWYSASFSLSRVYLFRGLSILWRQHFKKVPLLWGITWRELCSHLPRTPCGSFLDLGEW